MPTPTPLATPTTRHDKVQQRQWQRSHHGDKEAARKLGQLRQPFDRTQAATSSQRRGGMVNCGTGM